MTRHSRLVLMMGAVAATAVLAGCPPLPQPGPMTPPLSKAPAPVAEAPTLGNGPVAKGVFIAIDGRVPLTGEALERAKLKRPQILAALKEKAGQEAAALVPASQPAAEGSGDAEAPPLSVKYYLKGRQQFLNGANADAMDSLEKALKLDPLAFTVLRLMGRVCFAGSQLARGAMYLQSAQKLHPNDVEVNYLMGRYWLERNDTDQAVYHLMLAQESPERQITSIQTPLTAFYLGIALQQGGYHDAAARVYEHFIELSELPVPGYRYDGELAYLINMQWASHLSAAENDARVGNYRTALPHYRAAATARPEDPFIASRLVQALSKDGQSAAAQKAAMTLLVSSRGAEDALKLLAWTYSAAGQEKKLVGDLAAFLKSGDAGKIAASDTQKTIVLAAAQTFLGDRSGGVETFRKYLAAHPNDMDVLARLLKDADSADVFGIAMSAAAMAIAADGGKTTEVLKLFTPAAEGVAGARWEKRAVTIRLDQQTVSPPKGGDVEPVSALQFAALDYLEALTRLAHRMPPEKVEEAFEAALKWAPDFLQARESYIEYLQGREKFSKAGELIALTVKQNPNSAKALELEIESEAAQQRYVAATQLALNAREKFPEDIELRMQFVNLQRARGLERRADEELQGVIRDMPRYEPAYRQLVNSLFARARRARTAADASAIQATLSATVSKMAGSIPDSHFNRVTSAVMLARAGRYENAETVLRNLLASEPDDLEATTLLAQIWQVSGKPDQAAGLLESALKRKTQMEIVRSLAGMYREGDRKNDALALVRQYADGNPDSEAFALLLGSELLIQGRQADADAHLREVSRRFPRSQAVAVALARMQNDAGERSAAIETMRNFIKVVGATSDQVYLLAHFYSAAGDDDASVAALRQVLSIMPDHVGANNDLGYFWVDAGIHLDQAEPMIRKALESKPEDPAFMDSLGWLFYKQGKFAEARVMFEKALGQPGGESAEVVRHLGDSLYRLGNGGEAVERWLQAMQLQSASERMTAADRKERQYLLEAIAAVRAGKEPVLSPLGADAAASKSAGPASAPATMPR